MEAEPRMTPEPTTTYGGPFPKVYNFNPSNSRFQTQIDTHDDSTMRSLSKNELAFFERL